VAHILGGILELSLPLKFRLFRTGLFILYSPEYSGSDNLAWLLWEETCFLKLLKYKTKLMG